MSLQTHRIRRSIQAVFMALLISIAACKSNKPSIRTFATPDEAGGALQAAARSGDEATLIAIFGPDSKELISSGDPVEDKNTAAKFVRGYDVMHRWRKMSDGSQILLVGYDNFPFPIPLKKNDSGQWIFDTDAGKEEILNRRVGRNELAIINVSNAVANAQAQYFSQSHDGSTTKQYARKFISDPGKQNGLYWESPQGQPVSPLGPLVAYATAEGYKAQANQHQPFHGYYFAFLNQQGPDANGGAKNYLINGKMTQGFAMVAYPTRYGDSGIMTFIINQDGTLFQKDLGTTTANVASAMTEFNPDSTWTKVDSIQPAGSNR